MEIYSKLHDTDLKITQVMANVIFFKFKINPKVVEYFVKENLQIHHRVET